MTQITIPTTDGDVSITVAGDIDNLDIEGAIEGHGYDLDSIEYTIEDQ